MGAVNVSCAVLVPVATTFVIVGALGTVGAIVAFEEIEAGDDPLLLIATAEKEYVLPGARPEILAALI